MRTAATRQHAPPYLPPFPHSFVRSLAMLCNASPKSRGRMCAEHSKLEMWWGLVVLAGLTSFILSGVL
jgi:hypothetical protein